MHGWPFGGLLDLKRYCAPSAGLQHRHEIGADLLNVADRLPEQADRKENDACDIGACAEPGVGAAQRRVRYCGRVQNDRWQSCAVSLQDTRA